MASNYVLVSEVNARNETRRLLVRVIRMWLASDFINGTPPTSLEMVLMDPKGCKIQATVRRQLMYKFEKELKEGSVYHLTNVEVVPNGGDYRATRHAFKLKFLLGTRLRLTNNDAVPLNIFSFTPPADIFKDDYKHVIGILTSYGKEQEIQNSGKRTKMIEIFLISDRGYVDEFNSFLASGNKDNVVIAVLFAKAKTFQGKPALQNTYSTTKLIFNLDCSEAVELRKQMVERNDSPVQGLTPLEDSVRVSIVDELLTLTPTTTIKALGHSKEEDWWYSPCKCNKKVYPDSGLYFCDKCNRHISSVTPRYRIKLHVNDDTDSTTFVLFDREAAGLLKKSCAKLIESTVMGPASGSVPKEISSLVDQTMLFKVEVNMIMGSRFERSYRVKKVCNDADIIRQYNDLSRLQAPDVVDVHSPDVVCSKNSESVNVPLPQDLMMKFSDTVVESGTNSTVKEVIDLSKNSHEFAAQKRTPDVVCSKNSDSVNVPLVQDLMMKFSDTVVESGTDSKVKEVIDLSKNSHESTAQKRNRPDDNGDLHHSACPNVLKKQIKMEKD